MLALFMTSLAQIHVHKMAALTVVFSLTLKTLISKKKRSTEKEKKKKKVDSCCVYNYCCFQIIPLDPVMLHRFSSSCTSPINSRRILMKLFFLFLFFFFKQLTHRRCFKAVNYTLRLTNSQRSFPFLRGVGNNGWFHGRVTQ